MTKHKDNPENPEEAQEPQQPQPAQPAQAAEEPVVGQDEVIDALRAERDDLLARLQRVSADYVNYQKRAHRDVAQAKEFANEDLIKALLPVLDDLQRAVEHAAQSSPPDDPLLTGTQLVLQKALTTLEHYGLTPIAAADEPFDPQRHQALMQEPSDKFPPGTVLRELQRGYQLKGRTIRPANVVVSQSPAPKE